MKRRSFYIGPGAASLLLVIVVVSMSVLGLLALMSARSDERLMQRNRDFVAAEYETSARAERRLAELDALLADCASSASTDGEYLALVAGGLPEGMTLSERTVSWMEEGALGRRLNCSVEIHELGAPERFSWTGHAFYAESEEIIFE